MFAKVFRGVESESSSFKKPIGLSQLPDGLKAEHREPQPNTTTTRRQTESTAATPVGFPTRRNPSSNPNRAQHQFSQGSSKLRSQNESPNTSKHLQQHLMSEEEDHEIRSSRRKQSFTECAPISESRTVFTMHDQFKNSQQHFLMSKNARRSNGFSQQEEWNLNSNSTSNMIAWQNSVRMVDSKSADSRHKFSFTDVLIDPIHGGQPHYHLREKQQRSQSNISSMTPPIKQQQQHHLQNQPRMIQQQRRVKSTSRNEEQSVLQRRSRTPQLNSNSKRMTQPLSQQQQQQQQQHQLTEDSSCRRRRLIGSDSRGISERSHRSVPFNVIIKARPKDFSIINQINIPLSADDVDVTGNSSHVPFSGGNKRPTESTSSYLMEGQLKQILVNLPGSSSNQSKECKTDLNQNKENCKQHLFQDELENGVVGGEPRKPVHQIYSKIKLKSQSRFLKDSSNSCNSSANKQQTQQPLAAQPQSLELKLNAFSSNDDMNDLNTPNSCSNIKNTNNNKNSNHNNNSKSVAVECIQNSTTKDDPLDHTAVAFLRPKMVVGARQQHQNQFHHQQQRTNLNSTTTNAMTSATNSNSQQVNNNIGYSRSGYNSAQSSPNSTRIGHYNKNNDNNGQQLISESDFVSHPTRFQFQFQHTTPIPSCRGAVNQSQLLADIVNIDLHHPSKTTPIDPTFLMNNNPLAGVSNTAAAAPAFVLSRRTTRTGNKLAASAGSSAIFSAGGTRETATTKAALLTTAERMTSATAGTGIVSCGTNSLKSQLTFQTGIELENQEDVEELHFQLVDFQQKCKQWLVRID